MLTSADHDILFKILLIGDSGVGKSCLFRSFTDKHVPTIGVEFEIKQLKLDDGKKIKLQIWDTTGQEKFRIITTSYYREAHGIIIVYDITDQKSFDNVRNMWLDMIGKHAPANVTKILVGNKSDQSDEKRQVDTKQASDFAASLGMSFFETSTKTTENVEDLFLKMASEIVAKPQVSEADETDTMKKKFEQSLYGKTGPVPSAWDPFSSSSTVTPDDPSAAGVKEVVKEGEAATNKQAKVALAKNKAEEEAAENKES